MRLHPMRCFFIYCVFALLLWPGQLPAQTFIVNQTGIAAKALVYNPSDGNIYASLTTLDSLGNDISNTIGIINPTTGALQATFPVSASGASIPNLLALSDDGQFLYIGLDGPGAVARFNLSTQTVDLTFSLGASFFGSYHAGAIAVAPGAPHTIAVSHFNSGISPAFGLLALYDDGVPRANTIGWISGTSQGIVDSIAWSNTASTLYGYNNEDTGFDFYTLAVDSNGVTIANDANSFNSNLLTGSGVTITFDSNTGNIFATSGVEINPQTLTTVGTFGSGAAVSVVPDTANDLVYFLSSPFFNPSVLEAFNTSTFAQQFAIPILPPKGSANLIATTPGAFALLEGARFPIASFTVVLLVPQTIQALSVAPSPIAGGQTSTATLTLVNPAPANGAVVNLSSDNPAAQVQSTVTVPAGQTTVQFPVTTSPVASDTTVNLKATYLAGNAAAQLTVQAPVLTGLSFNPGSVIGNRSTIATVTLSGPAPASGVLVFLSSIGPLVTLPPIITVGPSGAATFPVSVQDVKFPTTVPIAAYLNGNSITANLTIIPAEVFLYKVSVKPATIPGGQDAVGEVFLNTAATSAAVVHLNSSDPHLTVPETVTVPKGAAFIRFEIATRRVKTETSLAVNATYQLKTVTAHVLLKPITLVSATFKPGTVQGGLPTLLTLKLDTAAPAGGVEVTLKSSALADVPVPATVKIPAGDTSVSVLINTKLVNTAKFVTVTATENGVSQVAPLMLTP